MLYPDLEIYNFPLSLERITRHMSVSQEHMEKVAEWRRKGREGTLTQDEMREAIVFLRAERMALPPAKARAKSASSQVNVNDLLSELDNL